MARCAGRAQEVDGGLVEEEEKDEEEGSAEEAVDLEDRDLRRLSANDGAVLNELRSAADCRIKGPETAAKGKGTLRLIGEKEQVKRARQALEGVLMGDCVADSFAIVDGAAVLKNLDPASLRYISESQENFEMELAVTLRIEGRSVHIWGAAADPLSTTRAREALQDAIVEFTEMVTESIEVPPPLIGELVNHPVLHNLRSQSRITTSVAKGDGDMAIRIKGLAGIVQEAKAVVLAYLAGGDIDYLPVGHGLLSQLSAQRAAELERDLGHLQQKSGTSVEAQADQSRFFLGGPIANNVMLAKHELMSIACFYFPEECDTLSFHPDAADFLAGRDDHELRRLSGVVTRLDRRTGTVWLSGKASCVKDARACLEKKFQKWERRRAAAEAQGADAGSLSDEPAPEEQTVSETPPASKGDGGGARSRRRGRRRG